MLGRKIEQRVIHRKVHPSLFIPDRIYKNRQKREEDRIQLKQEGIIDSLSLPTSHGPIPPDRENHNKVLVEVVKKQIGVSSVVFLSMEED